MKVFATKKELTNWVQQEKSAGKSIGLVPTMGALHRGHLELVRRAGGDNDLVVCSIFVNPIQFNNPEDLKKYPRTLEQDLSLLESANCHTVFYPDEHEIYPEKETRVYDFGQLDKVMEGRFRPGHFNGVAIVVKKLLDVVEPHRAYFGEKDFQQLQVVKALVAMEKMETEIVGCPTVREADGLALSSRNTRLTPAQRSEAPRIYQALQKAREMFPLHPVKDIREMAVRHINESAELEMEYFEIVKASSLLPLGEEEKHETAVACVAVFAGQVRLIDNLLLNA